LRVSTLSQGFPTQRHAVERAAAARGDDVKVWYAEKISGSRRDRPPVLKQLLEDARQGKVRVVYVYRLDRLSRRGIRDTLAIVEELQACSCDLVTVADGFLLSGPHAELIIAVMAWAAKMERLAIGERVSAAHRRVRSGGGNWGRPSQMGGALLRKARTLRARGASLRQISMSLRVSKTSVQRALSRKGIPKGGVKKPQSRGR